MLFRSKAVPIAIATDRRSGLFPDVPTFAEQGFPRFEVEPWQGVLGPRGLDRAVLQRLNGVMQEALRSPEVVEKLAASGAEAVASTPGQFAARIRSQLGSWGEVIRKSGMKGE